MTSRLIIASLILWAGAASAALPPRVLKKMRDAAPIHLTMKIEAVRKPLGASGTCRVTGPIAALYRNRGQRLRVGQRITVSLKCTRRGTLNPPSATHWIVMEELVPGRSLSAYLDAKLNVAAHGSGTTVTND